MQTTERPRGKAASKAKPAAKAAAQAEFKRHQVAVDDDRWTWLDGLPGGASKALRSLIDLAREQGFALDADGVATLTTAAQPIAHELAPVQPEPTDAVSHAETPDSAAIVAAAIATVDAEPLLATAGLDPATYVGGTEFHGSGGKVYDGTLGWAVNKRAAQMARVVYHPAHPNPKVAGVWQGQGRDFATWIFSEETGLAENLLKSGLELVMDAVLEPGASVGYHVHTRTEEIYYLLTGSLTVVTMDANGVSHKETLTAGDAHLVRPGQGHSCVAGEQGARYLTVAARV